MEEYPDPDEEYELLYQEEMEAMRDMEEELLANSKISRSKNSLSFVSPSDKENVEVCDTQKESTDNSKKRYLSESLADVSDLSLEPPSKRHKPEVQSHEFGVTSVRIPKWPFMPVSTDLGEKLYVKINNFSLLDDSTKYLTNNNNSSGLLVTPYSKLKSMAEEILKKKSEEANSKVVENSVEGSDLWVEKYRPKTYFDLLSDEAVNRTLLNWLKMWDKVVFNKEVKLKVKDDKLKLHYELDKDGRPHHKIALLCGPPGLGKTTLAHVLAVLAGYNVMEVNASDDRSVEALVTKLDAATQIQSVMGERKPSCLILDEIDGAPAPTVDFLLKYLEGRISEKAKKGKKDKPKGVVKRPVICICNEPYAPALRQLRQQAFVVHFPHTSSTKLAQRLLEICRRQEIKTDLSTLALLCDKTQNDIRSCISTLYFFKSKNDQRFKSADVINSNVGQKDIQKGMFNLWKEIFHIPVKKASFFKNIIDRGKEDEVSHHINYSKKAMDRLQNIVQIFQSAGDLERLLQGVFENFPRSKFSGSADSLSVALEWFSWFDLMDSNIKKEQNFVLMPYLPYGFAAWHFLFASNSFWKISYPTAGYENYLRETRCQQILNDVLRGLGPTVRSNSSRTSLLLDVLPMLNVILVPPIRSVNPTLFSEAEKKEFKQLVDIMIEYGLNFLQQRSPDGTYSYECDPNIDELSRFSLNNPSNTRSFSYNMKQIISHEIELERLRRIEESQPAPNNPTKPEETKTASAGTASYASAAAGEVTTNGRERTVEKASETRIKESEVQYKDFFGRIVKAKEPSLADRAAADKSNPVKSPIWFSFKEGYNNAVKKDITMMDIL